MIQSNRTMLEISEQAISILYREMGPLDALRFLNQFRLGSADYLAEKRERFDGLTVAQIAEAARKHRTSELNK